MIADSHRTYAFGLDLKWGIVRYKNVGVTLFTGFLTLKVDNTQMIGFVKSSASGIKIRSMSGTRYLTGIEYQYNAAKGFRGILGMHYHWNS